MNRYLFKAKRKDNNEWIYGYYLYSEKYNKHYIVDERITTTLEGNLVPNESGFIKKEVNPKTICRYTELNDKNNNMIFENDILINSLTKITCVVKYYDTRFVLSYTDRLEEVPMYYFKNRMSSLFEVIGNLDDEADNNE